VHAHLRVVGLPHPRSKPKNSTLRKNPFEQLPDEADYLSETVIEEQQEAERQKQLQNKPASEQQPYRADY
jgi:hypothetical protein